MAGSGVGGATGGGATPACGNRGGAGSGWLSEVGGAKGNGNMLVMLVEDKVKELVCEISI
jgi:hypothetical protein